MEKRSAATAKFFQVYLPQSLPFEEGTGLSRRDPCSRLTFQLLVERLLPHHHFNVGRIDEYVLGLKESEK
jgi:hypothetical protein